MPQSDSQLDPESLLIDYIERIWCLANEILHYYGKLVPGPVMSGLPPFSKLGLALNSPGARPHLSTPGMQICVAAKPSSPCIAICGRSMASPKTSVEDSQTAYGPYSSPILVSYSHAKMGLSSTLIFCCELQAVEAYVWIEIPCSRCSAISTAVGIDIVMTFMLEDSFCLSSFEIIP